MTAESAGATADPLDRFAALPTPDTPNPTTPATASPNPEMAAAAATSPKHPARETTAMSTTPTAIYRKKPVEVEAVQWTSPDLGHALADWAWQKAGSGATLPVLYEEDVAGPAASDGSDWGRLQVQTLEGEHVATPGDWLIRGVKGEFYFCKPDVFDATYELVRPT